MITNSGLTINGAPALPIWRDIVYSSQGTGFSALDAVNFVVKVGPSELASGRAVKRPGDSYILIRLNDIVAGFLKPAPEGGTPVTYQYGGETVSGVVFTGSFGVFSIVVSDPDSVVSSETTSFAAFADWSYDYNEDLAFPVSLDPASDQNFRAAFRGAHICLEDGVTVDADPRQFILVSTAKATGVTLLGLASAGAGASDTPVFSYVNTGERPVTLALRAGDLPDASAGGQVADDVRRRYGVKLTYDNSGTDYTLYKDAGSDYQGAYPIRVRSQCVRYCLYYQNAFGGWDWFLVKGRAVVSDSITRATVERRAASDLLFSRMQRRGTDVLSEELTKHLEAHTHWLSDDEASRMWHLTESANVYIHDLQEDIIYPAVLTGSEHVEKTYKNQGCKLVSYQIDLDFAVKRERR